MTLKYMVLSIFLYGYESDRFSTDVFLKRQSQKPVLLPMGHVHWFNPDISVLSSITHS